jgi:hypothetical protein
MCRTDFCHSRFYVPVPASRRFPVGHRAIARSRSIWSHCLLHGSAIALRRVAPLSRDHVGGRCLPVAVRAAEPLTPLSPPSRRPLGLALQVLSRGPPRSPPTHPRERGELKGRPECLLSIEDPCPATPYSDARLGPLPASWLCCPDHRLATLFAPHPVPLRTPCEVGPPSARTLAREPRLSRPGRRSSTSATVSTRGHTRSSCRLLAREWGFHPATRRHERVPVAWATAAFPQRRPASRDP